jgi:Flp pilus assembly protein TadG
MRLRDKKTTSSGTRVKALPRAGRRFSGEEGQSLIEFAFVLPMLMTLVFGVITFGIAINNYLMLTNATNSGAQVLAISRGQTSDPCATTVAVVYAAAPNLTQTNLTFAFVLNGVSYPGTSCTAGVSNMISDRCIHVAGAGARSACRLPYRHLGARRRAL